MIKNLFLVESPFQLLSAIEANEYFNKQSLLIIKYNGNSTNDMQLDKINKKISNFKDVIKIYPTFSKIDVNIKLICLLKNFMKNKKKFEKIFIGEYRSFHMRKFFDCLNPKQCYILDDGNIIIDINNYIKKKNDQYYFIGLKGQLKRFIYFLQSLLIGINRCDINRDIAIFTCFNLDFNNNVGNIKHNFEYIKRLNQTATVNNVVYFYGSNLKLLNISYVQEIEYLKLIQKYYKKKDLDIIYVTHRRESEVKINLIKVALNLEIKVNEFPAEVQMAIDNSVPKHICSFMSSVLVTLPVIYLFDTVTSFQFPLESVLEKYKPELELINNEYKKQMKVIELEQLEGQL